MSTVKNLWGELPLAELVRTPAVVLREQASQLTKLTNGILEGEVESGKLGSSGKIYHRLNIVAPALDRYEYSVVYVTHGVIVYPCDILDETTNKGYKCGDEPSFITVISDILSSATVHKAIGALLAQSKSEAPLGL